MKLRVECWTLCIPQQKFHCSINHRFLSHQTFSTLPSTQLSPIHWTWCVRCDQFAIWLSRVDYTPKSCIIFNFLWNPGLALRYIYIYIPFWIFLKVDTYFPKNNLISLVEIPSLVFSTPKAISRVIDHIPIIFLTIVIDNSIFMLLSSYKLRNNSGSAHSK